MSGARSETRRAHLAGLAGAAATAMLPRLAHAQARDAPRGGQPNATRAPATPAAADIPPEGIGRGIRHVSYSDQGGRPDGVQVMGSRGHLYVGHMFSDGVTVLDARDPRELEPVHYFSTPFTRTHHLQTAGDYLVLANGANLARSQRYDNSRAYFENTLADSVAKREPFRAGISIFDIARNPAAPREIAFLEMPGIGVNRLWWVGGRHAYVSAHFDGFTDHILCIVRFDAACAAGAGRARSPARCGIESNLAHADRRNAAVPCRHVRSALDGPRVPDSAARRNGGTRRARSSWPT